MNWIKYLKATRPVNLLMTIFILYSVAYPIVGIQDKQISECINFFLCVVSAVFLMAFGYLINDAFDVETDKINKPGKNIFETRNRLKPNTFMWFCASIGLLFPTILFLADYHKANLLALYVFATALLYIYARFLKNSIFIGNLSIALLSGLLITIPYLFFTDSAFSDQQTILVSVYALFAFLVTLIREIIKDAEDLEGDTKSNIKTLATSKGVKASRYFSVGLFTICFGIIFATALLFVKSDEINKAMAFFLLAVCGFFPFFRIVRASNKKHFSQASSALKIWMLLGVISMWI